jgi:MFS family permease
MLLGGTLISMVSAAPIIATTISVFLMPLSKEFGWGRTQFPVIILTSGLIAGALTPLAGRVLDRVGTKPVMVAGSVVFALGNVLAANGDGVVWHEFLIYMLIGSSASFTGAFGVNKIVSVWFAEGRGRALGLTTGLGVGLGAAMTPLLTQYFVQHGGWREAYYALAAAILLLSVPAVLFLTPDTRSARAATELPAPDAEGLSIGEVMRTREFWLLMLLTVANGFATGGTMGHWIPIQTGHGLTIGLATALLSGFGLLKIVAQVGGGAMLDRFQTPRLAFMFLVPVTLGIVTVAVTGNPAIVIVGAVLFGLGEGAENALLPYLASRYFGVKRLAEVFGYIAAAMIISGASGNVVMGRIFDVTGSYSVGLWINVASILVSGLAAALLGPYRFALPKSPAAREAAGSAAVPLSAAPG